MIGKHCLESIAEALQLRLDYLLLSAACKAHRVPA